MKYHVTPATEAKSVRYRLLPDDTSEDMWHAYNLIEIGDIVVASTDRKVNAREGGAGGGGGGGRGAAVERVKVDLALRVTDTKYDEASRSIRVAGRCAVQNDYVKVGAYHTLELTIKTRFDIEKAAWEQHHLERLEEAANIAAGADVAAVIMDASNAHVCLVTERLTLLRDKIQHAGGKAKASDGASTKFFETVLQSLLRHAGDWSNLKAVVVASPGFTKDEFLRYALAEAGKRGAELKPLLENKSKFVLAHAPAGHKGALQAVFADPDVATRLGDTKMAKDAAVVTRFFETLSTAPERAVYGWKHVWAATSLAATSAVLVSDTLLRCRVAEVRKQFVELCDTARSVGASVHVVSSMHPAGQQLSQITGLAAVLRYPVPELDETAEGAPSIDVSGWKPEGGVAAGAAEAEGSLGGGVWGVGGDDLGYASDASSDSDASYKAAAAKGKA